MNSALCVTSRPISVTGIPLANTAAAASGSTNALNSAAGVMLPSAIAPPIQTIRSRRPRTSGWRSSMSATFVSGPVGTSTTPGSISSARKSAACASTGEAEGSGSSGPSRPESPWTCAAVRSSRRSGASAPAATGMSVLPAISSVTSALRVVLSSVWLPATVVTPRSSTSGEASASRIAIASSWPGSQSMRIGMLTSRSARRRGGEPRSSRPRRMRSSPRRWATGRGSRPRAAPRRGRSGGRAPSGRP